MSSLHGSNPYVCGWKDLLCALPALRCLEPGAAGGDDEGTDVPDTDVVVFAKAAVLLGVLDGFRQKAGDRLAEKRRGDLRGS